MSNEHEMIYNSARADLIMPEYGRNIQKLIDHAKSIEDPEFRQAFVNKVVLLMGQINPQSRNMEDNREKLWKHLFRIADFDIDVQAPFDYVPTREDTFKKPETVPYPEIQVKFRHYGSNVQHLIKKAIEMEDGPKKQGFISVIGSYMKLAYRTWNKEHYVSDEVIKTDLVALSDGKLTITDDLPLDNLNNSNRSNNNSSKRKKSDNGGRNNSRGRGRGNGGRRKRS